MRRLFLSAALLAISLTSHATVYYVDSTATGANDGSSWFNAYTTLAQAMNAVQSTAGTDSILVAQGTYYPAGTAAGNTTNKDSAFTILRGGIKLYGGYPSGGGITRDPVANPVYLDGTNNSYHVMVIAGITSGADSIIIDGFSVRNGMAENHSTKTYNGQMVDRDHGGALCQEYDSNGHKTTIRNCMFTGNTAYSGGAMSIDASSPFIINCSFSGNNADPAFIYAGLGGAIFLGGSIPVFTNCNFTNNTAANGGVIYNFGGEPIIDKCTFISNSGYGGVMYNSGGAILTNSIFYGNTGGDGSVIYGDGGVNATNCTFTGNISTNNGGAIYSDMSNSTFTNCIVYGNIGGGMTPVGANLQNITYSIVQDGYVGTSGTGNIDSDPLFINAANPAGADGIFGTADDGLQLNYGSPALNTGNNTASAGIPTDFRNQPRIYATTVDMGAYEKQSSGTPGAALSTSASNNIPFIKAFNDGTWTYYAIPDNPDSIGFAIAWNGNTAAANAATVSVNIDAANTVQTDALAGIWAMRRYWNVNLNGQNLATPVKVRFYYAAADTLAMTQAATASGLSPVNKVRWFKTVGTGYTPALITPATINSPFVALQPTTAGTENNTAWVEFSNITSFSGGTSIVSAGTAVNLPVQLEAFNAQKSSDGKNALLNWQVGTEQQLDKYQVQRSSDGTNYVTIGNVKATGKADYTFTDNTPLPGKNYYRLNMADRDGSNHYSDTRVLDFGPYAINITVTPNPANSAITVNGLTAGMVVRITSINGRTLNQKPVTATKETVDISNLPNGIYMVETLQNGLVISKLKLVKE